MIGKKLCFIGLGNMGFAIVRGIISSGLACAGDIFGFDISEERCRLFSEMGCCLIPDARQAVIESDIVILAVKPKDFAKSFEMIGKDVFTSDKLVVSIAAGIPISRIKQLAGTETPVIRVIPNNPMLVGVGMSVMAYDENSVSPEQARCVEEIFGSCGKVITMEEKLLDPVIAIHSSSPAYLYLFARTVGEYGDSVGIGRGESIELFAQTMKGVAEMVVSPGCDLDELISAVKSPNGTTAAALDRLIDGGFCELIKCAMEACTKRAEELARGD